MTKTKIRKLLVALGDRTDPSFEEFDRGVNSLKSTLKQKIKIDTLDEVKETLAKFQTKIDFQPLLDTINEIKQESLERETNLISQLEEVLNSISEEIASNKNEMAENLQGQTVSFATRLSELQLAISEAATSKEKDLKLTADKIDALAKELAGKIEGVSNEVKTKEESGMRKEISKLLGNLEEKFDQAHRELKSRISDRGGAINRRIRVGGTNASTRYTDINFVAGTGTTLTTADDNTDREVDITITGGLSMLTATGAVNGTNTAFTFTTAPSIIFRDGTAMQSTSSDGTVNWTGTTSVTLTIAPNFDIFGL